MAIRGITKNIAITPMAQKNMDPKETYIPYQVDLRNGRVTDAGNWDKRPGYEEWRDLGVGKSIDLLIPEDSGYGVTSNGRIFSLGTTPVELTGQALNGSHRPIYTNRNDKYIICDGGFPAKILEGVAYLLGGTPPNARFVDTLGSYVLMAGQTNTLLSTDPLQEVRHSATNLEEDYIGGTAGSFWIKMDGDIIRNLKVLNEKVYVFKDKSIEVWVNIGSGAATFIRQQGSWIDKGCGADYSVVKGTNFLAWYADDGQFYIMSGGAPTIISSNIQKYIFELLNSSEIYGFDFMKEHLIRWFAPTDGKCFVFDYKNPKAGMYEDNTWNHGQWERMPMNSYMELNGKQYFGDYDPTGKVFEWSDTYKSDNSQPIRNFRSLRIRPSADGKKTRLNRIGFTFDRGPTAYSASVENGNGGGNGGGGVPGEDWTIRSSAADNQWAAVTYGNGLFVAVAITGSGNRVMTSINGSDWTIRSSAADNQWYGVTYGNGLFVAVATTGSGDRVMTSINGIDWTIGVIHDGYWFSVIYANDMFVAVGLSGDRSFATSSDGFAWTLQLVPGLGFLWSDVAFGNGWFVAVAYIGAGEDGRVIRSADGINWEIQESPDTIPWQSIAFGNGIFVAVGSSGSPQIMTSTNGDIWFDQTAPISGTWRSITFGDGLFVAVADSSSENIITSPDGINWTEQTVASANEWYAVTYGNGSFVAVAKSGTGDRVMTSP